MLLVGASSASADALPVNGRDTSVTVTGADELAGLGIGLSSNAAIDGIGRYVFSITGGVFDLFFLEGTLVHQPDLGITLSYGTGSVALTNFVIDTTGVDFQLFATATVVANNPRSGLWQDDGSHPTVAGTYLAAAVFYYLAPVDVIPDVLPGIGTSDDALVVELAFGRRTSAPTRDTT